MSVMVLSLCVCNGGAVMCCHYLCNVMVVLSLCMCNGAVVVYV